MLKKKFFRTVSNKENQQEHVGRVVELCEELKREMGQEAIALEINGEMYFI